MVSCEMRYNFGLCKPHDPAVTRHNAALKRFSEHFNIILDERKATAMTYAQP